MQCCKPQTPCYDWLYEAVDLSVDKSLSIAYETVRSHGLRL